MQAGAAGAGEKIFWQALGSRDLCRLFRVLFFVTVDGRGGGVGACRDAKYRQNRARNYSVVFTRDKPDEEICVDNQQGPHGDLRARQAVSPVHQGDRVVSLSILRGWLLVPQGPGLCSDSPKTDAKNRSYCQEEAKTRGSETDKLHSIRRRQRRSVDQSDADRHLLPFFAQSSQQFLPAFLALIA